MPLLPRSRAALITLQVEVPGAKTVRRSPPPTGQVVGVRAMWVRFPRRIFGGVLPRQAAGLTPPITLSAMDVPLQGGISTLSLGGNSGALKDQTSIAVHSNRNALH